MHDSQESPTATTVLKEYTTWSSMCLYRAAQLGQMAHRLAVATCAIHSSRVRLRGVPSANLRRFAHGRNIEHFHFVN